MRTVMVWTIALAVVAGASGVFADSDQDEMIKACALDYAQGWYTGDAERMERCLHPRLAKRIVRDREDGRSRLDEMSALELVQGTRAGWGKNTPAEERQHDVVVLDKFGNTASVKLTMHGWVDYLHIAKYNGEWKIVNVLWETKPRDD